MFNLSLPRLTSICGLVLSAPFFVAPATMAAPSGPIKTTKTVSAFLRPPNNLNSLVVAGDGNLYGTSTNQGFLVRVTPNGAYTVIHDFFVESGGTATLLTLGKDGNLYGILSNNFAIFKSDLAGNITVIAPLGTATRPASLIQASDGNFYGTTVGGTASPSLVFKVTPAGQVTILHSFAGDAAGDATELIETTPGVFYGLFGPSPSATKIFRITADGAFSVAHAFAANTDSNARHLVFAGDGNVYGSYSRHDGQTTAYSIFRLTPEGDFAPITDFGGTNFVGDVVLGGDGNLYATTVAFSGEPDGAISRITLTGQVTLLHGFTGQDDGAGPSQLAAGPNQVFGVTGRGSVAQAGTVYRVDSAGQFTTLVRLGTVGETYYPNGAFFQTDDGDFYGATVSGGSGGYGSIYHVASSGERTTLHEFAGDTGSPKFLVLGQDGRLYGATSGIAGNDSLFRLETSGSFTILHQFSSGDDGTQVTGLVASQDGNVYGLANPPFSQSSPKYGSFFRITPAGTFNVVRAFDQNLGTPGGLVETKDGKLYGLGAAANSRVLFQIATDGAATIVHSFAGDPIGGTAVALVAGADGNLYGAMTGTILESGHGIAVLSNGGVWRCSPTGSFTVLHKFDNADGLFSPTLLLPTANGDVYGLVNGSVFYRVTANGVFEPLYKFYLGMTGLIQGKDGNLYGTAGAGGALRGGELFKIVFGNPSAVNLATRMKVGTGDDVSIGGFIVTGNVPRKVLLRGIGASLSVAGKLEDPMLELHDASGAIIGRNNDWRITQTGGVITGDQSAAIKASGLAPSDDREAALIATLSPGNYTAVVSGTQNTTGIAVVEIYDLDAEASANLANLSTRGFAGSGDNVLIGGFITDGSSYGRSKLILRVLGPSLAQFGISNRLSDPSLAIYDSNGTQFAANDNWEDGQQPEITSYRLAPGNRLEPALYVSLAGGNYTAVVTSSDGTMGVALIETYNLP
jgi:uncharacterized repeat protein (TIGR03803 family)